MSSLKIITSQSETDGTWTVYLMGKSRWQAKAGARNLSAAERDAKVAEYQAMIDAHEAELAGRRQARSAARKAALASVGNPYKVGDVLYRSWGYDQTNIDFYEVVEVGARSVVIRPIGSQLAESEGCSPMSGHVTPKPGAYCGEPERKTLQVSTWTDREGKPRSEVRLSSGSYGSISRYDGRPLYCSWYA